MAYITKETTKKIREALKAGFKKDIKFSVSMRDHMALDVRIMQSPYFEADEYVQVNQYHISENFPKEQADVLNKVHEIIKTVGEYYNNSDIMTDYFDVAFYYTISIGRWDKGHIVREAK